MKIEFTPDQMVQVCVLDYSRETMQLRLLSCNGRSLSLSAERRFSPGTPLKIEWADYLLLVEVLAGSSEGVVDTQIRHALSRRDIEHFREVWI